jgi:hypothetical protein
MAYSSGAEEGRVDQGGGERRERRAAANRRALERVRAALASLRYGEVTVKVQDGVVVQVERTDKRRL